MKLEPVESFEDVAVTFSDEEWNMLCKKKRELYKEVMMQNYEMMISLGYCIPKEKLLALTERNMSQPVSRVKQKQKKHPEITQHATKPVNCVSECLEDPEKFAGKTKFKYSLRQESFSAQVPLVKNNTRNQQTDQLGKCFGQKTNNVYNLRTHAEDKPSEFNTCKNTSAGNVSVAEYGKSQLTPKAFQHIDCKKSCQCKQCRTRHQRNHTDEKLLEGTDWRMSSKHSTDVNKKHQSDQSNKHTSGNSVRRVESDTYVNACHSNNSQVQCKYNPHKCNECGRCYKRKFHLNRHKLTHTEFKPYECKDCGKSYRRKEQLVCHQWVHKEQKPFECTVCGKGFISKDAFSAHSLVHSEENMFKCSDCGKTFLRRHSLLAHQWIHAEEKPFKCLKCGKSFARRRRLRRHEMIHTQEKPFKCSECGKSFNYRPHLTRHQVIHTVKPFVCKECGKSFRRKYQLLNHHLLHTGERPFECTKCWRTFAEKDHVTQHEKLHV